METTENKPFKLVDEIDIPYEGQNTFPIHKQLKLKPAPLKAKLERIEMNKISSIKVREGFDYGLPQSIPQRNGQITISSVFGGYNQHYLEDGEKPVIAGQDEYIGRLIAHFSILSLRLTRTRRMTRTKLIERNCSRKSKLSMIAMTIWQIYHCLRP